MDELKKLERYLKNNGIRYTRSDDRWCHKILIWVDYVTCWTVKIEKGIDGYGQGLLELHSPFSFNPRRCLTAQNIIDVIKRPY